MLGCVHLPREREAFRDRRHQAFLLELAVGDTDVKTIVSAVAEVRLGQAAELTVDRQED
jgi:hypothetical protein